MVLHCPDTGEKLKKNIASPPHPQPHIQDSDLIGLGYFCILVIEKKENKVIDEKIVGSDTKYKGNETG